MWYGVNSLPNLEEETISLFPTNPMIISQSSYACCGVHCRNLGQNTIAINTWHSYIHIIHVELPSCTPSQAMLYIHCEKKEKFFVLSMPTKVLCFVPASVICLSAHAE